MSNLSDHAENQVLDEIFNASGGTFPTANPWVSLHTGWPGETGANELSGGGYARQQADFTAAAGGTLSNVADIVFSNLPAATIVGWGIWDAATAGNCFMAGFFTTVGGLAVVRGADLTNDDILAPGHGNVANDRVAFEAFEDRALPGGLTEGTIYWVISTGLTTDSFRVSTTQGGAAVDITSAGQGVWRRVTVTTFGTSGSQIRIPAGELDIYAY